MLMPITMHSSIAAKMVIFFTISVLTAGILFVFVIVIVLCHLLLMTQRCGGYKVCRNIWAALTTALKTVNECLDCG
jgi:Flp pilus assembly protein TadB